MNSIGWLGSICLALCGFPQAWMSIKNGNSDGVSPWLLWLWGGGEILTLLYVIGKLDAPLIFNYACNLISVGIIAFYKLKPTGKVLL